MEIRMDGRSAVITGGSAGLGKAMAQEFVASGANVAIVARRADVLDQAAAQIAPAGPGKVITISADIRQASECTRTFKEAEAAFGQVDILVNNAGTSRRGPFLDISDDDWQEDFDLKVFSAIRLARLAIPGMRERKWGRIINLLNVFAKTPDANTAPTSISRAAGMALTKVLSAEGAPNNILVNALLIGSIKSDQIVRRYNDLNPEESLDEFVAKAGARLPMGRMGEAEECANTALFLASDASSYLTGCAINMDGGLCKVP